MFDAHKVIASHSCLSHVARLISTTRSLVPKTGFLYFRAAKAQAAAIGTCLQIKTRKGVVEGSLEIVWEN